VYSLYIFFFQAEDGIRDFHVTGVQTCALPISEAFAAAAATADWTSVQDFNLVITNAPGEQAWPITATNFILMYEQPADAQRSAEIGRASCRGRVVGWVVAMALEKECR